MFFIPPDLPPIDIINPYLDPVSSGAILQTLLAILLGISLFVRAFWRKINSFLEGVKSKFSKEKDIPPTEDATRNTE